MSKDDGAERAIVKYSSDDFEVRIVELPGFGGLKLPLIILPDGRSYWPIAAICEDFLHVAAWRQIQKLNSSGSTAPLLTDFEVHGRRGRREITALEYNGIGHWFQLFNPNKLKPEHPLRDILPRFQSAAVKLVNSLADGGIALEQVERGELAAPEAPEESRRLTIAGVQRYTEYVETRVENVERLLRETQKPPYVNQRDDDGFVYVPFTCEHGTTYTLRLRLYTPEIVEIVREGDEE